MLFDTKLLVFDDVVLLLLYRFSSSCICDYINWIVVVSFYFVLNAHKFFFSRCVLLNLLLLAQWEILITLQLLWLVYREDSVETATIFPSSRLFHARLLDFFSWEECCCSPENVNLYCLSRFLYDSKKFCSITWLLFFCF